MAPTSKEELQRDFLLQHSVNASNLQEAFAQALLEKLSTNFQLQSPYTRYDLADLFFIVDQNNQIVKLVNDPDDPITEDRLLAELQGGSTLLVPTFDEDGKLNFSKPVVFTAERAFGYPYLLAMSGNEATEVRQSLPELPPEPGTWDKIMDFFYRFVGSRDPVCLAWDNANDAHNYMASTLATMIHHAVRLDEVDLTHTPIPERDMEQQLAKSMLRIKQNEIELQSLLEEEEARRQQWAKQADRNAQRIEKFNDHLLELKDRGINTLKEDVVNNHIPATTELVVNRALSLAAQAFLDKADKAPDRNVFLLQHQQSFLSLANDISEYITDYVNQNDLYAANIYSDNPYANTDAERKCFERLDAFINKAINNNALEQERLANQHFNNITMKFEPNPSDPANEFAQSENMGDFPQSDFPESSSEWDIMARKVNEDIFKEFDNEQPQMLHFP